MEISPSGVIYSFKGLGPSQIGFSLDNAKKGDQFRGMSRGFLGDFNGELFYKILDTLSGIYLKQWSEQGHFFSEIKNCTISITKNNDIVVGINTPIIANIFPKRLNRSGVKKGEMIKNEDVAGIVTISFENFKFDPNNAIIHIFSSGWRRGIYFDFLPLVREGYQIQNLEFVLATCYDYLMSPHIFNITPSLKSKMFSLGWFPFLRLLGWRERKLINAIQSGIYDEDLENLIIESFDRENILTMVDIWMNKSIFRESENIIRQGINRYLDGDPISAIHILYPSIEGIMRRVYSSKSVSNPYSNDLRDTITSIPKEKKEVSSTFLLDLFNEYLQKFFFQRFDYGKGNLDFSRTTIAHGVVKEEDLTKKNAFIGILILDQLFYYIN